MLPVDIESCLDSMVILVDTREQPSARADKRYKAFGIPYKRQKLNYGDYTYNFTLPDGNPLYADSESVSGAVVIERKESLNELSGNFCRGRTRFKAEFSRASEAGATTYLLVEDASWEKLINGNYGTKFNPAAYLASVTAWMARYGTKVIFCKKETSGKMIKEILYRELKERLESGFYG